MHEASHVDLHALRAERKVDVRRALLQLGVCINQNNLVFEAHQLRDALLHPLLDDVYLHLFT